MDEKKNDSPQIACPRCMPPGDPCCPYCGGTYGVDASQIIHTLRHDPEAGAIEAMRERMSES